MTGLVIDSVTEVERSNLERFLRGYEHEQEQERDQSEDLGPSLGSSVGPSVGPSSSSHPSLSILMGRIGRVHVQVQILGFLCIFRYPLFCDHPHRFDFFLFVP